MVAPVNKFMHGQLGGTYVTKNMTLSADAAGVSLDDYLIGGVLYSVEIKASADDEMVFTIYSGIGTALFTKTTTAATDGHIDPPTSYWPINSTPTYTLSGLGSGTVTIEITVWKS